MARFICDPGFGIRFIGKEFVGSYYLMHHGVKGQKHGVRQWQNKDGSYTPEGYQHYKEMYGWGEKKGNAKEQELVELQQMERLDVAEKMEKSLNRTNSEVSFEGEAYRASHDHKLMQQINDALKKSGFESLRKTAGDYVKQSIRFNKDIYDKYSKQWSIDHPGKAWDGDGTEFHEELYDEYPEYAKEFDRLNKLITKFVKDIMSASKDQRFADIKGLEKYNNLFDKYGDKDWTWCRIGNVKSYIIAKALAGDQADMDIFPEHFIESFTREGKHLASPWLMDDKDEE